MRLPSKPPPPKKLIKHFGFITLTLLGAYFMSVTWGSGQVKFAEPNLSALAHAIDMRFSLIAAVHDLQTTKIFSKWPQLVLVQ